MSKNNAQLRLARNNTTVHKRMYKAKSHWNVVTTGAVALGALALGVVANENSVSADTVVPSANNQQAAIGSGAVTTSAVVSTSVAPSSSVASVNPGTTMQPVSGVVSASTQQRVAEGSSVIQGPTTSVNVTSITPTVNLANSDVASAFSSQHNAIEDAGGTLNQTSTSVVTVNDSNASEMQTSVKSDAQSQLDIISVAASVDTALSLAAKSANASLVVADSAIDVSSMTVDQIKSLGQSQTAKIAEVTSANNVLDQAVSYNTSATESLGGKLVFGSTIDTTNMTSAEIAEAVSRAAEMVDATGSANRVIADAIHDHASDIATVGGQLNKQSAINTADNMTVSDVNVSVQSQSANISVVASADRDLLSNVASNLEIVSNAGGTLMAGSAIDASKMTPEQIKELVASQVAMITATGSANVVTSSIVDAVSSQIEAAGGKLVKSGVVNTADNMTTDDITSQVASQSMKISEVLLADQVLSNAVSTATPGVDTMSGVITPGASLIDATNLTPEAINSLVMKQVDMLAATSNADVQTYDALSENASQITKFGGEVKQVGTVNTADNMTVSQVLDMATKQAENIYHTASGDRVLSHAVKKNISAVEALSGQLVAGSAIDVSSMTGDEITSLAKKQRVMIKATANADTTVSNAIDQNQKAITDFGGTVVNSGTVNTADNMTSEEVESVANSEVAVLSGTASVDVALSSAVSENTDAVARVQGSLIAGSAIDTTNMSLDQMNSLVEKQTAMIKATADADTDLNNVVSKNNDLITGFNGKIEQDGTVNTADNMTSDQVASMEAVQNVNINATGSADVLLSQGVADNNKAVTDFGGSLVAGSNINVSSMTPEQIASLAQRQLGMIKATADADMSVSNAVAGAKDVITSFGGSLTNNSTINTADNMTASDVASIANSQTGNISATVSGVKLVSQAVVDNDSVVVNAGGKLVAGSAIDTSSMTLEQIASMAEKQAAMIIATGSADSLVMSAVDKSVDDIRNFGGDVESTGSYNTADNMNVKQVASYAKSEADNIVSTGENDKLLSQTVASARPVVEGFGGIMKAGHHINVSSMTPKEITALAQSQMAMVDVTAEADRNTSTAVSQNMGNITGFNGTLTQHSTYNTADNMNVSEVQSYMNKQSANISETGSGDVLLSNAVKDNQQAVSNAGGSLIAGSAIDTTNMTSEQISSIVNHQQEMIKATGQADGELANAVNDNQSNFTNAGAALTLNGTYNTADNMTAENVSSIANSQTNQIIGVGHDDQLIASAQVSGANASKPFGGNIYTGTASDVTTKNLDEINSLTSSQVAKIGYVANNNVSLSNLAGSATPHITAIGGQIVKGDVIDVTNMSDDQLNSLAAAQGQVLSATAQGDITISNAVNVNKDLITGNGGTLTSVSAVNVASENMEQIESRAMSQEANMNATGKADKQVSDTVNANRDAINAFGGTVMRSTPTDVTKMSVDEIASLAQSQADNIVAVHNGDIVLSNAIDQYHENIEAFGGQVIKGSAVDVTTKSPAEILSLANSQSATLSATASGDVMLSKTVSENVDPISLVEGTITRADDINTANMTVDQVNAIATSQHDNITNTASQDRALSTAIDNSRNSIQVDGGRIHVGSAVNVASYSLDQMKNLVSSQATQMTNIASANVAMKSAIDSNSAVITGLGGTISSVAAVDATGWSVDQMNSLVQSQATNMSELAYGDQVLTSGVTTNSSAAVLGDAKDFTGSTSEQVASYVGSQVVALGRATDADRTADSQVNDLKTFNATAHYVDVVASTAEDIASFASENVAAHSVAVSQAMWSNQMHSQASDYNNKLTADANGLNVAWGNEYTVNTLQQLEDLYNQQSETINHAKSNGITNQITLHKFNVATIEQVDAQMLHIRYLYHPLSMTYKALDFTTTPLSTSYHVLSSVGGVTPLSTTYSPLSTTYYALSDVGGFNPQQMGTTPFSMTYKNFTSDGSKVAVYNEDGTLNDKFTGFTPLSTTYRNFSSDATGIKTYNDDGTLNKQFTGFAPLSTSYWNFVSDGSLVDVYNEDGTLNDKFTGFTPLSTTYKNFSSDGSKVNVYNEDGTLNDKFTGFTPLSTTYKNFSSDGSKVNVYNEDGTLNDKFTGFTPLSTTYKNFSSDGAKVNVYNEDGTLNEKFTGYVPLEGTYQVYESDGSKVKDGDKFTGYAAFSTNYSPYSSDETVVKDGNKTGFASFGAHYSPVSTSYHFYMDQQEKPAQSQVPASSATSSAISSATSSAIASSAVSSAISSSVVTSSAVASSVVSDVVSSAVSNVDSSVVNSSASSVVSSAVQSSASSTGASVVESADSSGVASSVASSANSVSDNVIGTVSQTVSNSVVPSASALPVQSVSVNTGNASIVPSVSGVQTQGVPSAGSVVAGGVVTPTAVQGTLANASASQQTLPQTGTENNRLALLGLAVLGASLSMTLVGISKHEF